MAPGITEMHHLFFSAFQLQDLTNSSLTRSDRGGLTPESRLRGLGLQATNTSIWRRNPSRNDSLRGYLFFYLGGKTALDKYDWAPDMQAVSASIKFAIATGRPDTN
jgi:hypothetical protein